MVGSLILGAASAAIQGVSSYQSAKAGAEAAEAQANAQIDANNRQAAQVQQQAEQDVAMRSRQLARDMADSYAQWAGNGLAVGAGGASDSLGRILSSQKREGEADIDTIRQNAKNNIWSISQSSKNTAKTANMQIDEYSRQMGFAPVAALGQFALSAAGTVAGSALGEAVDASVASSAKGAFNYVKGLFN